MKLKYLILAMLWLSLCSINYIPYRGVYYEISNISRDELIKRIDNLGKKSHFSELIVRSDLDQYMPYKYVSFSVGSMDVIMHCKINIGDATKEKDPKINFTHVRAKKGILKEPYVEYADINSSELTKEESQFYMAKFESEILSKLRVEWVRNEPSDFKDFINIIAIPLGILLLIILFIYFRRKRLKRRSQA